MRKILLLGGKGDSTNIVFNYVNENFGVCRAILEEKENTKIFLKRRIKRLGLLTVLGQISFQLLIVKPLDLVSKKRKTEIIENNQLNVNSIPPNKLLKVDSINSDKTIQLLKEFKPDLIIINGTRIISKKVLNAIPCKFINTHAGITPKYRGVHGTYWALVNNDIENSGVTVHFVDSGIDTGNIIAQTKVKPSQQDNFVTYPLLQLCEGLKLLHQAIEDYFNNGIITKEGTKESNLWYHPTIWQYLYYAAKRNVR